MIKAPVSYYGGKTRIAGRIAALLPAHRHYVEPYCGSLAVLFAKPPSAMETVNDADEALMTFWRVLRDREEDLARVCALTPHSRAEHKAAYRRAANELETARRVWVLLTQGRTGTFRPTGWRHYLDPAGSSISMPGYLQAYRERMGPAAARLTGVSLECREALDVIGAYGQHRGVLLYVDPPYLASTRTGTNYRHEMQHPARHRRLAEALHAARAAVVLSGYPSDLYDRELYPDWHRHEIPTGTGQGNQWSRRVEVLWSNRPFAGTAPTAADTLFEVAQ